MGLGSGTVVGLLVIKVVSIEQPVGAVRDFSWLGLRWGGMFAGDEDGLNRAA